MPEPDPDPPDPDPDFGLVGLALAVGLSASVGEGVAVEWSAFCVVTPFGIEKGSGRLQAARLIHNKHVANTSRPV